MYNGYWAGSLFAWWVVLMLLHILHMRSSVIVILYDFLQGFIIKMTWLWSHFLRLLFYSICCQIFKAITWCGVARLSICNKLLTSTTSGISETIYNFINYLRSNLHLRLARCWWRLLVVHNVHRLETSVLAQLRCIFYLVWIYFSVDVATHGLLPHSLISTLTTRLDNFGNLLRLLIIKQIVSKNSIVTCWSFKTHTTTRFRFSVCT